MDGPATCATRACLATGLSAADILASCGHVASLTAAALPSLAVLTKRSSGGALVAPCAAAAGLAAVLDLSREPRSRLSSLDSAGMPVRPQPLPHCLVLPRLWLCADKKRFRASLLSYAACSA